MKSYSLSGPASVAFLLLAFTGLRADPPPPSYQIIDLGAATGGTTSLAHAINASGDIAGQIDFPDHTYSYVWKFSTKKMTCFNTDGTHGSNQAYGINKDAEVVGYCPTLVQNNPDIFRSRAYLYKYASDKLAQLDPTLPALDDSYANAINDAEQVVGYYFYNQVTERGFIYDHGMIDLGTLTPTGISLGTALNNDGHVVGNATKGGATRAFIWIANVMTELTAPSNYSTYARGINSVDHIAGIFRVSAVDHAMFYSGGVITDLGNNGGQYSDANGINDSDQVVGEYKTAAGAMHAFLHTDGTFHDLNDLIAAGQAGGFTLLQSATAINAQGWIAGYGTTSAHGQRSFVAIPAGALTQGPPVPVTGVPDALASTGATLHGTLNPDGFPATAWFDYGTTTRYGSKTGPQAIASGTDPVDYSAVVKKLKPHTTYHFRATGKNSKGQVSGTDATFTTPDSTPIAKSDLVLSSGAHPLTVSVLANDTDADRDHLVTGNVTPGAFGTTTIKHGKVIYTPGAGFTGSDSFTYSMDDGFGGGPVTGTVFIVNKEFDGLVKSSGDAVSGSVKITLSAKRSFSLALNLGGHVYSTVGSFASSDDFHKVLAPHGLPALTVDLHLDLQHASLTCALDDGTDSFTSNLPNATSLWPGGAHKYTAELPADDPALPRGIGYGTMSTTATGLVSIVGKLGDGTGYSVAAPLHADGTWNFYHAVTKARHPAGFIGGAVTFAAAADSDCAGPLHWLLPDGTTGEVGFKSAIYIGKAKEQVLTFTNPISGDATFTLDEGNLDQPIQHQFTVSSHNVVHVTDRGPDKLKVKINDATGLLSGTFIHPAKPKHPTAFSGVIYQKQNLGGTGLFIGVDATGTVKLVPQ